MDLKFLSKLSQNDTLQRLKREQKLNNHLKQHQHLSSDDEHDAPFNANPPPAVVVIICFIFFLILI